MPWQPIVDDATVACRRRRVRSAPRELRQPPLRQRLRALGEVLRLRAQLLRGDLLLERHRERGLAAASITRFASPTAIGAHASSSSTSCCVAASSSSGGATRFTSPIRSASSRRSACRS